MQKHRFAERQILPAPAKNLDIVVVIPAYCEEDLLHTLNSLEACIIKDIEVEVIVVFNSGIHESEAIKRKNTEGLKEVLAWREQKHSSISYHFLHFPDLPKKHAGVGLARKIGMDEAVDRFEQAENEAGIIVCLDADSTVLPNYFREIHKCFVENPKTQAVSIYFEHPLEGSAFSAEIYRGITYYELFLRYYIEGLRFSGHPYAYHTIGSSMAVRTNAYQQQGGMNRRKAGEDFYFLQKFIELDVLSEINTTIVFPSPRPAENVPFGTGKAIKAWLDQGNDGYLAYAFPTFKDLKVFLGLIPAFYQGIPENIPASVMKFLEEEQFFAKHLHEICQHVSSQNAFVKRFYRWFNALKVLKYVHFVRDHYYPQEDLVETSRQLIEARGEPEIEYSAKNLLTYFRNLQREFVAGEF